VEHEDGNMELSRNSSWNVTNTPGRDSDCLWTPRGNGLVFISFRGGEDSDLYLQDLEGGEPLNLSRFPEKETVMGFFALPEALKHPQQ
jgi:Tol biopolymer transport system component